MRNGFLPLPLHTRPNQRQSGWNVLDSALWLACVSAILYVAGSLYKSAYHGTLGLPSAQWERSVPATMVDSILPLFVPLVFLIMAAALLAGIHPGHRPFYPIPVAEVTVVVWGFWALKLLGDLIAPSEPVHWNVGDRRNILYVLLGAIVLATRYWRHAPPRHRPLRMGTSTETALQGFALLLCLVLAASLSFRGLFSGVPGGIIWTGLLLSGALAAKDIRRDRKAPQGPSPLASPNGGVSLLGYLLAGMLLLVSSSVSGTLEAREELAGCTPVTTVSFDPPLAGGDNGTYWLLLHDGGNYYLRALPPAQDGAVTVVPAEGATATLGTRPAQC